MTKLETRIKLESCRMTNSDFELCPHSIVIRISDFEFVWQTWHSGRAMRVRGEGFIPFSDGFPSTSACRAESGSRSFPSGLRVES